MLSSRPSALVREVSRLRRPSLPTRSSLCAFCAARRYYYSGDTISSTPPHHQHTSLPTTPALRSFSTSQRARTLGTTAAEASSSADDPSVLTTTPPTTTSTTTDTTTSTTSSTTPSSSPSLDPNKPLLPYTFQTGFSFFAKRASRPFPPPFISPPTSSFSEPLSTHHLSRLRRRRPGYKQNEKEAEHEDLTGISSGGLLRGYTNGDDALLATPRYLAVADGVGAWNTKPHGNAALWSRLMLHYFSIAADRYYTRLRRFIESGGDPFNNSNNGSSNAPIANPVTFLQEAYTATMRATTSSSGTSWLGTTTACVAVLFPPRKLLVANLGDSQCRVLRPREHSFILKTEEQWHWFDCPRQLGTNSPDTPETNAVLSSCELEDDDIVILATDGLPDNLWEHEIVTSCLKSLGLPLPEEWGADEGEEEIVGKGNDEGVSVAFKEEDDDDGEEGSGGPGREWERSDGEEKRVETDPMTRVASDLVRAAKAIATDPYAESPWMERAIDEAHLAVQGGKPDDISVVAARLRQAKY